MLSVIDLHAHYGRAHILHGVTLAMARGEVVALVGRNGAGKSTTMKAIMGLLPPTSGQVLFEGKNLAGLEAFEIARAGIGYVPEDRRVFSELTVMENLAVGERPPRADAPRWTPEALFTIFPNLARMKDRPGGRMSGGEQQMLTIARTLMGNPALVLLDEPSEGLAPVIIEDMARAILKLKGEGLTVLVSEQNLHFARLVADRAVILEKGIMRHDGPMAALLADDETRNRYLAV
jgi:branched-chain amino acid transport system ATP-binding protein